MLGGGSRSSSLPRVLPSFDLGEQTHGFEITGLAVSLLLLALISRKLLPEHLLILFLLETSSAKANIRFKLPIIVERLTPSRLAKDPWCVQQLNSAMQQTSFPKLTATSMCSESLHSVPPR